MTNFLQEKNGPSPASRWRRQPIYAATRLRCAVAMLILAFAVVLSALPSFATHGDCDIASPLASVADVESSLLWRKTCTRIARHD